MDTADQLSIPSIEGARSFSFFFEGQFQHALFAIALGAGALVIAQPAIDGSLWLGRSDQTWFMWGLAVALVHQIAAWFLLRVQVRFRLLTRLFRRADLAVWGLIHITFLVLRLAATIGVAAADSGSMALSLPATAGIGALFLVLGLWGTWSAVRHAADRIVTAGHFRERYRNVDVPAKGAYRLSRQPFYTYGCLLFWGVAVVGGSRIALAVALFQYTYIWVYHYCIEAPNERVLAAQQ